MGPVAFWIELVLNFVGLNAKCVLIIFKLLSPPDAAALCWLSSDFTQYSEKCTDSECIVS